MADLLTNGGAGLTGRWERSLLRTAEGYEDTRTEVVWLQGPSLFVDLRLPPEGPAEGFAGVLTRLGGVYEWWHEIDLAGPAGPDAGTLTWEDGVLVERGVHEPYLEHWRRAAAVPGPCWALRLAGPRGQRAVLVRAGDDIGWACGPQGAEVSMARMRGATAVVIRSSVPGRTGAQLQWSILATTVVVRIAGSAGSRQSRWRASFREGRAT